MARRTSCGVIVTDGPMLLLGHATGSPRWDIPKGLAEPGEDFRSAASRELQEETGLEVAPGSLRDLGVHSYMPGKDLALFVWQCAPMPDPRALVCHSGFTLPNGAWRLEFDRFGIFAWDDGLHRVGKNLARVLGQLRPELATPARGRSRPAPG
ncbi:MAG TPA: NUDIX domain-containing protein [Acetobacteraceae bacterium]|nr:NUDIX domain-containing protein [Acetobacteraceae bacterium]